MVARAAGVVSFWGREPALLDPLCLWRESRRSRSPITLDLSELEFVSPLDLVALAAWSQSLPPSRRGNIILPLNDDVPSYLERMDLLPWLRASGWEVPPAPAGPRRELFHKLLELSVLPDYGAVEELADRLPRLLARQDPGRKRTPALGFASGELCDNAISHSGESPIFVAAQRYTGRTSRPPARLELAVADVGIGIPSHLRGNPRYSEVEEDPEAIALALKPGVTGTRDHRGYGFHDVLEAAQRVGMGELLIFSGRGSALVPFGQKGRRSRFASLKDKLPGTLVVVRFHE